MPLFEQVVGQERALGLLRQALASGPAHAYLFTGPVGVGKSEAALDFAAALCCGEDGCGECSTCRRIREGLHPDVEVIAPEGSAILIDQIRSINGDVALRPFEARARVYVLLEAEAMNLPAANAFLKTLEEPPPHAYFILVTSAPEELPETIVSRCQRVLFTRPPAGQVADYLRRCYATAEDQALTYARVAQGDLNHARALATSERARRQRDDLLDWARRIPTGSFLDAHLAVDELMAGVEARAEERVAQLEEGRQLALAWAGDARARARVEKRFDERVKRERRRSVAEAVDQALLTFAGWYRDLAVIALDADEAVFNRDRLGELRQEVFPALAPAYLQAVEVVRRARERFRYNVDTRSILEDMVLAVKEALH